MKRSLKPVKEQVIVITGASSGIGLATAFEAGRLGAQVVLISRNESELKEAASRIKERGGEASYCVADVAEQAQVERAAELAAERYGGFDTWVNNAGVSVYGRLVDVPLEEKRRVFDVNFWGVVHGCKAALKYMKERGGAIINIGSEISRHPIPLQGIYSASKHAVKAYTEALRMELERDGIPVSVTLIRASAINTPYTAHARNHMERDPELPAPVYAPEVVARAILACAERRIPSLSVGGTSFRLNRLFLFERQKAKGPRHRDEGLIHKPSREGELYGDSPHRMRRLSLQASARLHPVAAGLIVTGLGGAIVTGVRRLRKAA